MDLYKSLIIVIPVIDEKSNLEILIPKIKLISNHISIFIIDDNSKDGTSEFLGLIQSKYQNIHYLNRSQRLGIGSAHVEGLNFARQNNFDFCITMDGDQTHNPDFIPNICTLLGPGNADLVLTSRFMKEGGLINWDLSRIIITYLGHFLTTLFIGSRKDLTSGMRGYRCGKVPEEMLKILKKSNYEFFPLSFLFYKKSKMRIAQIPITLPNRFFGHSKITLKLLVRNIYCIVFSKRVISKLKKANIEKN